MSLYIIDGYNVMHGIEKYQAMLDDLESARAKFVEDLAGFSATGGDRAMVVFDAHLGNTLQAKQTSVLKVEVCFTARGQSADNFIERYVRNNPVEDVLVVTSDNLVKLIVSTSGAGWLSPEDFKAMMGESSTEASAKLGRDTNRFELGNRINPEVLKVLRDLASDDT